ncbi:hypothetical protein KJ359_000579 [Pestalotiopsis sp. 9143b]|nr:hypothetical protein KJ359_000579 [Pestalotiopsis sp. 9143b]
MSPTSNILIYFVRRDLRVSDNPILHHLASTPDHGFTHLLPVYVFASHQIEVSGFIQDGSKSPYPEAKSEIGRFWRCGPHRAKIITSAVWDMKNSLEKLGSGLCIRAGQFGDILKDFEKGLKEKDHKIGAVWVTSDEGVEEKRDEKTLSSICADNGIGFKLWADEKYFVDEYVLLPVVSGPVNANDHSRDLKLKSAQDLPDVFTSYRKMMEPLRERPRPALPKPEDHSLPKLPPTEDIPSQRAPFDIPSTYDELEKRILDPIHEIIPNAPSWPEGAITAHPFGGGETTAQARLQEIITNSTVFNYKHSRNGLVGIDFSTKLSAFLALGTLTARQVHAALVQYEDGNNESYADAEGYGGGENEGSKSVRFELLWRDYMRLCTRKFTYRLFRRSGFRNDHNLKWKSPKAEDATENQPPSDEVAKILQRVWAGTTGMGLIDASQRELIHTGYTSNRARQNVASFLAKHLGIDWRYGAEWYEMLLVDYDVSSNWSNWQYVSGVGNDPRGEARIFNPVKQAFDYDKNGDYVKMWVPELRQLDRLENVFQACTTPKDEWKQCGLTGLDIAENPIKKIEFSVDGKPNKHSKRPFDRRRKDGRIRSNANMAQGQAVGQADSENGSNGTPNHQNQFSHYDIPQRPRNDYRGGRGDGRGGRGGFRGGNRGRGFGSAPRGAYRGGGGRGQFSGYGYPNMPNQWPVQPTQQPGS